MKDGFEELREKINGKQVMWRSPQGNMLSAICIWPPHGTQISIKPYELTPEKTQKVIYWRTLKEVKNPKFCLTSMEVEGSNFDVESTYLSNVPSGGTYDPFRVTTYTHRGSPSCPYG